MGFCLMNEVQAKARFVRMAPQKVRLVVDVVRGMSVAAALSQLRFMKKAAALPVYKVIHSAAANATHNFQMDPSSLFVKTIRVDEGPMLHRVQPRARGSAAPIRKRMSHIMVGLMSTTPAVPVSTDETNKA